MALTGTTSVVVIVVAGWRPVNVPRDQLRIGIGLNSTWVAIEERNHLGLPYFNSWIYEFLALFCHAIDRVTFLNI